MNPAPVQRVRFGHWHSACQQQNPRTCVLRDREVGLLAQATSRQPAAGGSTELPGCGNTAAGIRRARRPGPIRRPLCCERATDPARSWPRGRERENYEQKEQNSRVGKMQTAFGWAAETTRKSCSFPKSCASTEIHRKFQPAANNEQQTANNNTHLQLASSNTFRSYIVLRQTAVHSVQPARTSDEFCAGGLSVSKSTCKKK